MVKFLVAIYAYNGAHISFRVGDVLTCVDDLEQGYSIHHKGEEELIPKEYFRSVAALNERVFQENGELGRGAAGCDG